MAALVWLVIILAPVAATLWVGRWLVRSWAEERPATILSNAFAATAGGAIMFLLVGAGVLRLMVFLTERCTAAALTLAAQNDCDPGPGGMFAGTLSGLPWLLISLLGAVFTVAAMGRWMFTRS